MKVYNHTPTISALLKRIDEEETEYKKALKMQVEFQVLKGIKIKIRNFQNKLYKARQLDTQTLEQEIAGNVYNPFS